jgi:succinyl-diaminopimelate desuccinylase
VPDLLALTAQLVGHRSESFHEAPFVDWLEAELRALPHLDVVRVGDNLVARTGLDRPMRLLLVGHTDTVPAKRQRAPPARRRPAVGPRLGRHEGRARRRLATWPGR